MHIARLTTVTLIAALAISCRDAEPTSPTGSAPSSAIGGAGPTMHAGPGGTANIVIPAPGGYRSMPLARGSFADAIDATFRIKENRATTVVHVNDPTQMVMAMITFDPGGALPWHTHPGPALVTVTSGELTLVDGETCEVHRYPAGSSFIDPGQGHVHVGLNASNVETTLYVTYLDVPVGESPLQVATVAPDC